MSSSLVITDGDLHAYLLGSAVSQSFAGLRHDLARSLAPGIGWQAAAVMAERARRCAGRDWQQEVHNAFAVSPHNLAERFLESALLYRIVGQAALPDLLPLALVLLRTDLHAYFTPRPTPYRDHLAHQTRVAALAHLLLDRQLPLQPWTNMVDRHLAQWWASTEHALLAGHLARLGLGEGLPADQDQLRSCLQAAALLAGLVHDLGYALGVEASLGDPETALHRLGVFPEGGYQDPPAAPLTRLYRSFYQGTGPGQAHASFRAYVAAHPCSPHSLAGALWLAYLPERLQQEGLLAAPGTAEPAARGRCELIFQLAAMMALAHDLPVDSRTRQAEQGFRLPGLEPGTTLLDEYPGCTFFALADLLHEMARPVVFSGPQAVSFGSPVLGLELLWPDEWTLNNPALLTEPDRKARHAANQRCQELGLWDGREQPARVEIFWVLQDQHPAHFALPRRPPVTPHSTFDPAFIGCDIPARLQAWGLDRLLCQRAVPAAADATVRATGLSVIGKKGLWLRRTVAPASGALAIHPLSRYVDDMRQLRDQLHLRPLQ